MEIPPRFEADLKLLRDLERRAEVEPAVRREEIELIQGMLEQLGEAESLVFQGALQNLLGSAHYGLPTGDREENLEQAIACYRKAVRFFTPAVAPLDYAAAWNNLGIAYRELGSGDRAANLDQAIACFQEALRIWTAEAAPDDHAETQYYLAWGYADLPTGDRATNLQRAIACSREALRFWTAEAAPRNYAGAQNLLGVAYAGLPTGDRAANLERAIGCFGEALRFWTADADPGHYALAQNNLGAAYRQLPTGDQAANLDQAIGCFKEALRVWTPETAPRDYANAQNNLGLAHAELPTGDRAANLERAIACYGEALRFWTAEAFPHEYARAQNNLGAAYIQLPTGDRATNLQRAIACSREALRFWTAEAAPRNYAGAQNLLGVAYAGLPTGDRAANLERAIGCFGEALRFWTADADPGHYALAQNNLGAAYRQLPTGDQAANLDQAIGCFKEALRVWTPETAPRDYANAQNNLGLAHAELPTGDRAANLERAIACYGEALRFWTAVAAPGDYAIVQGNLGRAYGGRLTGDRATNLELAIACFTEALRFWTPAAAPTDYALMQGNLAEAYNELPTENRAANAERAIALYGEALRFLTAEAAPVYHRAGAGGLALLYFREGEWEEAQAAYASAIRAGDLLYEATATGVGRQAELGEARELVAANAYCLARLGRMTEAVECLEGGRARALAEDLARDRTALGGASERDRAAFVAARNRIKALEAEARGTGTGASQGGAGRMFVELSEALAAARTELTAVVGRIRRNVPGFMAQRLSYAEIAESARADRPLVYLLSTMRGSLALIVSADAEDPTEVHALWLDGFASDELDALLWTENDLGELTNGLLVEAVRGDLESLQATLVTVLRVLGERLMGPLVERLGALGSSEVTIVPTGRLSLLPLPAAAGDGFTVALAPSARALHAAETFARHAAGLPRILLAVGNPLPLPDGVEPLAFAAAEAQEIGPLFGPGCEVLVGAEATKYSVQSRLEHTTHLHLACHGSFDTGEPLDSGLVLAGGERLTLRNLLDEELELPAARLAVLSACQSGITEFGRVPDEVIGLPAGFIQAGVPGVISTLWPIDDISTALLMVEFYRLLLTDGLDPARALCAAQEFLRTSNAEQLDLAGWFERRFQASGGTDRDAFEATTYYRANLDERPFADPVYWAGFVFSGV